MSKVYLIQWDREIQDAFSSAKKVKNKIVSLTSEGWYMSAPMTNYGKMHISDFLLQKCLSEGDDIEFYDDRDSEDWTYKIIVKKVR